MINHLNVQLDNVLKIVLYVTLIKLIQHKYVETIVSYAQMVLVTLINHNVIFLMVVQKNHHKNVHQDNVLIQILVHV